jgi:hypothetical protein
VRHQRQVRSDAERHAQHHADADDQRVLGLEITQDVAARRAQGTAHADGSTALADPEAAQSDDAAGRRQ